MDWSPDLYLKTAAWIALVELSLFAGLVVAYGRERHQGRAPDRQWWLTRLYALPFLSIFTAFLIDQFKLNGTKAAFAASMLAMMAYEIIGLLYTRGIKGAGNAIDAVGGAIEAAARPYHSIVDTDKAGRAAAHIAVTDPKKPVAGGIGEALRETHLPEPSEDLKPLLDSLNDMDDVPGVG